MLGRIMSTIAASPTLGGHTLVLLTAGAGGRGTSNVDRTVRGNYSVPFVAWGPDVVAGADLYDLNPAYQDRGGSSPATRPPSRSATARPPTSSPPRCASPASPAAP